MAVDSQGPGLRLQPRRASGDRVRQGRPLPRRLGRGRLLERAWHLHRPARSRVLRRQLRPHGAQVHDRRRAADDARRGPTSRPTPASRSATRRCSYAGGAVQHGDQRRGHRERRDVHLGRLRQRPRPPLLARRASCWRPGASPAAGPASSTCRTASRSTGAAGSTSPTARTTASRSSPRTATS